MRVTEADVTELRDYLAKIVELLPRLDFDVRVGGGASVGQLAFHAGESADHWIRLRMLGDDRPRDRDAEFDGQHAQELVAAALDRALEACAELVSRAPELGATCANPPSNLPEFTVLHCLVHATAHTAEHVGHLESTLA
jgi:uncharacterized damage-inducible protein DinB